ncbi:MAG: hypothetical protein IAI50_20955 [Candidatus Eremiobacteraeota bacterium]|nr:hypothetical protein [Candidatus Eremiobacteraeota bacterium]
MSLAATLGALLLAVVTLVPASATPVAEMRVAGVGLYMTPSEVTAALSPKFLQIHETYVGCATSHMVAMRSGSHAEPGNCLAEILATREHTSVYVVFVEDYPANPGVMRAFSIRFYTQAVVTDADASKFNALALRRFGPPTSGRYWCGNVTQHCLKNGLPGEPKLHNLSIDAPRASPFGHSGNVPGSVLDPEPMFQLEPGTVMPILLAPLAVAGYETNITMLDIDYASRRCDAARAAFKGVGNTGATGF